MIPEQIDPNKEPETDNEEENREEIMRRKEASYAMFRVARDRPSARARAKSAGPLGKGLPAWTWTLSGASSRYHRPAKGESSSQRSEENIRPHHHRLHQKGNRHQRRRRSPKCRRL